MVFGMKQKSERETERKVSYNYRDKLAWTVYAARCRRPLVTRSIDIITLSLTRVTSE